MKKVLIITYYWPPGGGAGVQRWLKFTKYLRDFGWEPIIYTAANGEMPVIDHSLEKDVPKEIIILKTKIWEPYSIYKLFIGRKKNDKINAAFLSESKKKSFTEKIAVWIRGNFFIPDARRFWIKPSAKFLDRYLRENPVDAVVSTGPPHSMHLIALRLKEKNPSLKWLADFRDPWTNIDFYEDLMLSAAADRKHHRQELSVLKKADAVVSIGKTMSEEMHQLLNTQPEKFHVITNGYDEEDLFRGELKKDEKFSIAHIGSLVKSRNPSVLWKALRQLIDEHPDFKKQLEIKLVGKVDIHVTESIAAQGLQGFVRKIDYLPHNEVIKEQQRSKVLLLLVNDTKNSKSILTGKFFEYLASSVPILAIGPTDGDLAEILRETNSGLMAGFHDETSIKAHILALFKGHQQAPDTAEIKKYSRRELTRKLSEILNKL